MAWEHHYGIMLPIFVWMWFAVYREGRGRVLWLAMAWVLIADFLSPFNFLAGIPVANVLQSYMYFGARCCCLGCCCVVRRHNRHNQKPHRKQLRAWAAASPAATPP